uniref:Ig-like domain-containing protein n=1 Tax=Chelydra serpentina TaxID=8475 RepID=A0A8C3SS94_CHESE
GYRHTGRGLSFLWPSPSISVSPGRVIAPGAAVTLRCQCWCWGRRVFLYKDGIKIWELFADGDEFAIPSARRADAGLYVCRSHAIWEVCLTASLLLPAETYHPKPSIFLRPRSGVALGGAVTVRCRGRHQDVRFLLYKVGNPNALQDAAPAGDVAEFPIRNVSRGDAGSYNCRYSTKSDPPVWSEPSDPAVLVVAGEGPGSASPGGLTLVGHSEAGFALGPAEGTEVSVTPGAVPGAGRSGQVTDTRGGVCVSPSHSCLCVNAELPAPRPSISVSPSGVIAPGGAVTIRCQCRCEARRLLLYKDGVQIRELDADGAGGEFTIPSARREDSGSYSCRSRSRSEPPNWSDPSDDVRIVVAGERSGLASLLPPSPTPSQTHRGSLGQWDPQTWGIILLLHLFSVSVQHSAPLTPSPLPI